jgi:hypothetical protein
MILAKYQRISLNMLITSIICYSIFYLIKIYIVWESEHFFQIFMDLPNINLEERATFLFIWAFFQFVNCIVWFNIITDRIKKNKSNLRY